MWGNRIGWVLSAFLIALVARPLWMASEAPRPSQPSGVFPGLLSRVALPADPRSVATGVMNEPCDAGEPYRQAIQEYESNRRSYDKYFASPRSAQAEKPKALELLVQGGRCSDMTLFARTPSELLNYRPETPGVEALEKLGRMANQVGLLHQRDKNPQEARRYFEAMHALGYHLYFERVAWSEFTAGMNLMADAARGLAKVESDQNNPDHARSLEHFADALDQYKLKQFELYKVVSTIDSYTVGRYGGDILALARGSPETMWRGEAILALGRMKYNTPHRGDQLAAAREVQQWTNDPNLAVRAAANAAAALTLQQYKSMRVAAVDAP
jgi:hypothetical protein